MCPYSEFFWSVFSCIRTEYGEIRSVWENTDQKNSEYVDFLHSVRNSYTAQLIMIMIEHTAKNTVISSISWCGNFVERHSFRTISGDSPKTMQKLCFPQNFYTRKFGEITVQYFSQWYPFQDIIFCALFILVTQRGEVFVFITRTTFIFFVL